MYSVRTLNYLFWLTALGRRVKASIRTPSHNSQPGLDTCVRRTSLAVTSRLIALRHKRCVLRRCCCQVKKEKKKKQFNFKTPAIRSIALHSVLAFLYVGTRPVWTAPLLNNSFYFLHSARFRLCPTFVACLKSHSYRMRQRWDRLGGLVSLGSEAVAKE